jgi:C_GCAxxG_C_C family probable redox protein
MNREEAVLQWFDKGYNCAQAVFAGFGPDLGLSLELCLALSSPFGGGIGREGEVCGAISGALLVIGLAHSKKEWGPAELKEHVYGHTQALLDHFKARHGTLLCRNLIGCELKTPEGRRAATEKDVHHTLCPAYLRDVVEFLENLEDLRIP